MKDPDVAGPPTVLDHELAAHRWRPGLPFVSVGLGGLGLLAGATPDAAAAVPLQLTGNPTIDAMLVAGVVLPAMGALGWAVKFTCGAGVTASAHALRAWADYVDAKAKATKDTGDDGPATAASAFARAFANSLERAQLPRAAGTPGITHDRRGGRALNDSDGSE